MTYIPIIGLEIHAELTTKSKAFCSCENSFGGEPNTRCCPTCTGLPGALPSLNAAAVEKAVLAGAALGCKINLYSAFDRKHYFYPDLPKAYQITQNRYPICGKGEIDGVGIERIHIEEDAGKLVHEGDYSYPDFNRCGVPLIEIVTKPDIRDAKTAARILRTIACRLKFADVCDAKMEQGSLRCDVNISLMPQGGSTFGTRVEIKNIGSFRAAARAIEYEISRQTKVLESGADVVRETRKFDADRGITLSMRVKESETDYRYMPEPDIPPLELTRQYVQSIIKTLPEMPESRRARYIEAGLDTEAADLLTSEKYISDTFDKAMQLCGSAKTVYSLLTACMALVSETCDIGTALGECAALLERGAISKSAARSVLEIMTKNGKSAEETAKENGFMMSQDRTAVTEAVTKVLKENQAAVSEYKGGSGKVLGFLIGQVSREIGKDANPRMIREELLKKLQ